LLILHHFRQTYNYFFISVPNKKNTGKTTKWVIFPELLRKF